MGGDDQAMAVAEIIRQGPGEAEWSGRTSLTRGLDGLHAEVTRSLQDPARLSGALFATEWLRSLEGAYPPHEPCPLLPSPGAMAGDDEDFYGHFPGWQALPPPAPYSTAPLPLPFVLPAKQNECPIDAMAPWWERIVLPEHRHEPPAASAPTGTNLWIGHWTEGEHGWEWNSDVPRDLGECTGAGLDVMDTCVDAWSRRKLTAARICPPGLIGSLIPGYAEMKTLASTASQQTITAVLGCRVGFAFISAVTFTMQFDTEVPMRWAIGGKYVKQLLDQRGYAESRGFDIGIEFSDGWRPYRARLMGEHVPIEQEARPLEFARWLSRRVAHDRLQRTPQLTDDNRAFLDRVVESDEVGLREVNTATRLWRTLRVELPGHRPISVELA